MGPRIHWHAYPADEIHKQSRTAEQREQDKGDSHDHGVDVQIGSDSAAHAGDDGIA